MSAATRLRRYGNFEDWMMSESRKSISAMAFDAATQSIVEQAEHARQLQVEIEQLQAEVERLKSEQQGEMWYALDYGFEGQYYELESIIEDFESDYGTGDIEEVKVAQLTTVKHPNKFLAKLWVDGAARLFDTREEAEAAIAESKEQAND